MVADIHREVPACRPGAPAARSGTPARGRSARALAAVAASGALLVSAAGAATAAPATGSELGPAAQHTSVECLEAYFPGTETTTTPAVLDEWLSCMGLTDGSAGEDPTITRGEAAEIAHAAVGAEQFSGAAVFDDVRSGDEYFEPVTWLGSVGVVQGYADGEFKPERDVTRDELATLLVRVSLVEEPSAAESSTAS